MGRINVKGVIVGIALIQLYAAIRSRFGAGPATAVTAGIFTRRRGRSQVLQGALSRGNLAPYSVSHPTEPHAAKAETPEENRHSTQEDR